MKREASKQPDNEDKIKTKRAKDESTHEDNKKALAKKDPRFSKTKMRSKNDASKGRSSGPKITKKKPKPSSSSSSSSASSSIDTDSDSRKNDKPAKTKSRLSKKKDRNRRRRSRHQHFTSSRSSFSRSSSSSSASSSVSIFKEDDQGSDYSSVGRAPIATISQENSNNDLAHLVALEKEQIRCHDETPIDSDNAELPKYRSQPSSSELLSLDPKTRIRSLLPNANCRGDSEERPKLLLLLPPKKKHRKSNGDVDVKKSLTKTKRSKTSKAHGTDRHSSRSREVRGHRNVRDSTAGREGKIINKDNNQKIDKISNSEIGQEAKIVGERIEISSAEEKLTISSKTSLTDNRPYGPNEKPQSRSSGELSDSCCDNNNDAADTESVADRLRHWVTSNTSAGSNNWHVAKIERVDTPSTFKAARIHEDGAAPLSCPIPGSRRISYELKFNTPQLSCFDRARVEHEDFCSNYIPPSAQNVPCLPRRKVFGLPSYDEDEFDKLDNLTFIDSHCHLDFLFKREDYKGSYRTYRSLNRDTFPSSYEGCVAIFCDPKTFGNLYVWRSLLREENVWAAFGCHPHMAGDYGDEAESHLLKALEHEKVVALGEIGLDYSYKNNCNREHQKNVFERQLLLAKKKNLPLVIHSRDASEDTLKIMKAVLPSNYKIHRHCFTGDYAEASQWLNTFPNLFIGLTGLVTFPSAAGVHEVARRIPLKRLLLETDTPYFVPRHLARNKKWSNPGMAIHVAAQVAAIRMETIEEVIRVTRSNTREMYGV